MNKNLIIRLLLSAIMFTFAVSCMKYDDSDLYSKYNSLDSRVSQLESRCQEINRDIASLKSIVAEGVKASVVKSDIFTGKVSVTIGDTLEEGAKVLVFVVDKGQTVMQRLSFENSIMRYNTGGFNAPSREIIYRRAMELSKGSSYTYDFEDFAAFDAKNRKNKAPSARTKALPHNTHPDIPYGEPEITVNKEF